jgi:hypothetical protein
MHSRSSQKVAVEGYPVVALNNPSRQLVVAVAVVNVLRMVQFTTVPLVNPVMTPQPQGEAPFLKRTSRPTSEAAKIAVEAVNVVAPVAAPLVNVVAVVLVLRYGPSRKSIVVIVHEVCAVRLPYTMGSHGGGGDIATDHSPHFLNPRQGGMLGRHFNSIQ